MWAYTDDVGPDDSAGGWGSNPVRRLFGPGTEWWVEECACCLCGCLSTGPVFIIIGLLFLLTALTDPRYQGIRAYDRAVSAWTTADTGGMAQLQSVFPNGNVAVVWSNFGSSRLDPVVVSTTTTLAAQTSVTALNDSSPALETYTTSLWYEGSAPQWAAWPSSDWFAQAQIINAARIPGVDATQLQLVQCSNERAAAYGSNCTTTSSTETAASAPPSAANISAAAADKRRSLAQWGGENSCEVFLRVVRTPAELAFELVPPRGCTTAGSSRCDVGNWTLRLQAPGCGTQDESTSVEVAEDVWLEDLRSGDPPAWCANWTTVFSTGGVHGADMLPAPPVVTVRSALDPYVQAAQITGCSYNFGPTTAQYAAFALNLVLLGCAVITCSGCCLAALVARSAAQQGPQRGEAAGFGGPFGGAYSGYGTAGGVSGASYGYGRYF